MVKEDDCVSSPVVVGKKDEGVFMMVFVVESTNGNKVTCGIVVETLRPGFGRKVILDQYK